MDVEELEDAKKYQKSEKHCQQDQQHKIINDWYEIERCNQTKYC